jgi:hypothetical protein
VTRALALGSFVLGLTLLAGGCAAQTKMQEAAPSPKAPEGVESRRPLTELDALEHDLAVSEQRLEAQLVRRTQALADPSSGDRDRDADSSKKTQSAEPPAPREPAETAGQEEKPRPRDEAAEPSSPPGRAQAPVRTGKVGSPCDMACRALSSMRRSAERICELAGASDERCTRARGRVSAAEERIRHAQCECVGGGSDGLNASL